MTGTAAVFAIDRTAIDAVVFDMDGVVTRTAEVHAAAWNQLMSASGTAPATEQAAAVVSYPGPCAVPSEP